MRTSALVAVLFAVVSTGAAHAATTALPPPDNAVAVANADAYRIGPQDKLDINVFQIAELTRPVQVGSNGKVLLPLVGEMQAAGRTPTEFSGDLTEALKKTYMKNPVVTVTVNSAESQRVTVDGAVNQPGVYPLTGPTTLLQAVSLAKGPDTKLANVKRVAIFRQVGGERRSAIYDLSQVRSGKQDDPRIYGNDIVVVDASGGKAFMQNFQGGFGLLGMMLRPW